MLGAPQGTQFDVPPDAGLGAVRDSIVRGLRRAYRSVTDCERVGGGVVGGGGSLAGGGLGDGGSPDKAAAQRARSSARRQRTGPRKESV